MKRYDKYKPSGIDWIGEVPVEWEVKRLRFIGNSKNGLTYNPEDVCEEDEGVLVLRSSNIQDSKLAFDDNVFVKTVPNSLMVKKGDLIICSRNGSLSLVGKCALVENDIKATFGAFMLRFITNQVAKYTYYAITRSIHYYKGLMATTTVNQLTVEVLNNMIIPIPSIPEQTAIAAYLDAKCVKIDNVVEVQQKRIELFKELKQSIITHAVTKGLDKNAKMKASGIDWIGVVPEHWEVKKLKFIGNICSGDGLPSEEIMEDGDYEVYGGNGVCGYSDKYNVTDNHIIIGRVGALCGNIHISKGKRFITDNALIYTIKNNSDIEYLAYLMITADFNKLNTSSAQPLITGTKVMNVKVCVPPLPEQTDIAAYLDKKCAAIDRQIAKVERQIDLLNEYKQSVITECVTGKRKVC